MMDKKGRNTKELTGLRKGRTGKSGSGTPEEGKEEKERDTSGTPEEGKGGKKRSRAHTGHQRDTVGGPIGAAARARRHGADVSPLPGGQHTQLHTHTRHITHDTVTHKEYDLPVVGTS